MTLIRVGFFFVAGSMLGWALGDPGAPPSMLFGAGCILAIGIFLLICDHVAGEIE